MPLVTDNPWDDVADEWDEAATVRAYADAAFSSLIEVVEKAGVELDGGVALDFGCGTGQLTRHLAERCDRVDAVDTSPAMLARLRSKVRENRWDNVAALDAIPERSPPYDIVVCASVLAFVDDHPSTVRDLVGRLRPDGLFVQWDWEAEPDDADHAGLTRNAVEGALEQAGLSGGAVETAFTIEADGESMRPLLAWGVRR